jgi:replication initiation and membrane attachment protein
MKLIRSQDFVSITSVAILTDVDLTWIVEFYQPLLGPIATSLYLTLKQFHSNQEHLDTLTFQQLMMWTQTQEHQLNQARQALEAVGLLRTYLDRYKDSNIFSFVLYAPKQPEAFMDDPILSGLLKQYADNAYVHALERKYKAHPSDYQEEISASFADVFHADLTNPVFAQAPRTKLKGRTSHDIRQELDRTLFQTTLKNLSSFSIPLFDQSQIDRLFSIAQLTGIDEIALAEATFQAYQPMDGSIDFDKVTTYAMNERKLPFLKTRIRKTKSLSSTNGQSVLLDEMEKLNPVDFLQKRQNGGEPALSDVRLVEKLAIDMQLPHPVINALVHHVLETKNNTLSRAYTEKLAASLGREGLTNALDTLDYFIRVTQATTYVPRTKATDNPPSTNEPSEEDIQKMKEKMKKYK